MEGLQFQKGKKVFGTETTSLQQRCVKSGSSETEPRAGLLQIPLYEVFMHSRDSLVYLCYFQGQVSLKGIWGNQPAAVFSWSWCTPTLQSLLFFSVLLQTITGTLIPQWRSCPRICSSILCYPMSSLGESLVLWFRWWCPSKINCGSTSMISTLTHCYIHGKVKEGQMPASLSQRLDHFMLCILLLNQSHLLGQLLVLLGY